METFANTAYKTFWWNMLILRAVHLMNFVAVR